MVRMMEKMMVRMTVIMMRENKQHLAQTRNKIEKEVGSGQMRNRKTWNKNLTLTLTSLTLTLATQAASREGGGMNEGGGNGHRRRTPHR